MRVQAARSDIVASSACGNPRCVRLCTAYTNIGNGMCMCLSLQGLGLCSGIGATGKGRSTCRGLGVPGRCPFMASARSRAMLGRPSTRLQDAAISMAPCSGSPQAAI